MITAITISKLKVTVLLFSKAETLIAEELTKEESEGSEESSEEE